MSDLARLLQQYGYGQPNALAQDGVTYDTSNVLAGMPKPNALASALRVAGAPPKDEHGFLFSNVGGELKFNPYEAIKNFMSYKAPPGALSTSGDDAPVRNSAEAAGWLGLSGLGLNFAGQVPKNALGIFGGRLAKTADHNALTRAEEMAAKGADRREIWDQTGWFQGADGKWRFEIDDSKAVMKPEYTTPHERNVVGDIRLKDAFDHPALFAAYPEIAEYPFSRNPPQGSLGGFDTETKTVYAHKNPRSATSDAVTLRETPDQRSVVLHEAGGHGVQGIEGFAPGAGPNTFTQQADAQLARDALSWRRELERMPAGMDRSAKENAVIQQYRELGAMDWVPSREARDLAMDTYANPTDQLSALVKFYGLDTKTSPYSPRDMYRRTAGETEARNVQARANMTPEERRAKPPWETEDTPPNRQLIIGR